MHEDQVEAVDGARLVLRRDQYAETNPGTSRWGRRTLGRLVAGSDG
jgi:hypothetical protein